MKRFELYKIRKEYFHEKIKYRFCYWLGYDYSILDKIMDFRRNGRGSNHSVSDCIIMGDTETSKKRAAEVYHNHVCAWTISIRAYDMNICTLYGRRPSEMMKCIKRLLDHIPGEETIIYFHNLSYDWTFLRQYFFESFGMPEKQLNTKPHYPIYIKFDGLTLKDSLILAQRSLDKWGTDLDVEHKKSVGSWDYDKLRTQHEIFTKSELEYIEHDTLCGVECIDALMHQLKKNIATIPYTATGIPREAVRKIGKEHHARDEFLKMCMTYDQYQVCEQIFHGGYTHTNRFLSGIIQHEKVTAYDFASSYPFVMLTEKYPSEKFTPVNVDFFEVDYILSRADERAYMFKFIARDIELKDAMDPVPPLQFSKCIHTINVSTDNGRVMQASYVEIYLNEIDLKVIAEHYRWHRALCVDVEFANKSYLPRWFTDYVYHLFEEKTKLKGGDPVQYALSKATLNSLYGMTVQKNIRDDILEDYESGEFYIPPTEDPKERYQNYLDNYNSILPFFWGTWVTSYSFYNLFDLIKCTGTFIYSDTDSCYGMNWDMDRLNAYNKMAKQKLTDNGYTCVHHNNREYWLGVAELDGIYTEFVALHSKCYCGRSEKDGKLHITVAGVPKCGAECLNDNIANFHEGFVFDGETTGKRTHTYFLVDKYIDPDGNETADSIDLSICDYEISGLKKMYYESFFTEEVNIQIYE